MAAALLLLVGGSIAFASQALDSGRVTDAGPATAPPPPAPTLLAPAEAITRSARVDVTAIRPLGLRGDQQYRLRLYVNNKSVREGDLPDQEQFVLREVPLEEGDNSIRASLVGAGGESDRSAAVSVTRDDVAPVIRVLQPAPGATVYADAVTLVGRTEAGADLALTDLTTSHDLDVTVQPDGRFSADLSLALGDNPFLLHSTDRAGNKASARISFARAVSAARVSLAITPTELAPENLPTTMQMVATVRDELGHAVDGAQLIFSVSPPDSATSTYRTTSTNGTARWNDLRIDPGDASGTWLVTVLAVLPSGAELRDDESFSLQ